MTDLSYLQAAVIGALQGVTELFPISSLGHSVLVPAWLGGSWAHLVTEGSSAESGSSPYLAFVVALHVATAAALLVFYRNDWIRIVAAFVTSFNAADVASYRIVGSKGQLHVDPAYEYAEGLAYELAVNGKTTRKRIGKRDQFAPELLYFSDCILKNKEPEPSGYEGLQDVRIVQALYESAETGKAVAIPPFKPRKRPTADQQITRPGVREPQLVKVESASE